MLSAQKYAEILSDKNITDLKKMEYKYSKEIIYEAIDLFKTSAYQKLPLLDFNGSEVLYMESLVRIHMSAYKTLIGLKTYENEYGLHAMVDEIHSTLAIENINSKREIIRNILNGAAPKDKNEDKIYEIKKGLDFIADTSNKITEKNIYDLYMISVGFDLNENDRLKSGNYYRHDAVYIVGDEIEHEGLPYQKLQQYMQTFIAFINSDDGINHLVKSCIIHFYLAFLHPYFDGNGRMARLLQLWYLVQQGYSSAMFIPLSSYVNNSKSQYYKAFTLVDDNSKISGVIDISPFIIYFVENVFNKLKAPLLESDSLNIFNKALQAGEITEKEKKLFSYVLSAYGNNEFSTKLLEKDYRDAAYATIRSFVLKFEELGILSSQKYSNRIKYKIK